MTNFDKLVAWDADFYNSLASDDCIVCLTEQQIYLVGQIIEQLKWYRTRWTGDLSGMDFVNISEELEERLADRVTCEQLTQMTQIVNDLQIQLTNLQNTVNNYVDTADDFDPQTTTIESNYPDVEDSAYTDTFTVSADTCDTAGKDAIYGAAKELVAYIHQTNIDALQNIAQLSNYSDQIERLIAATPIGLLPFDEMAGYATFILENILQEYEATVDEELLENVTCDLFCRFVANDCTVDIVDVSNYMGQQLGAGFDAYLNTFADTAQFALTGTVSGDEIFYAFSLFQIVAATLAEHFFDLQGATHYLIRAQTGLNNPDNDWTLLCDECPDFYRLWTWDFAYGMGDWTFEVASGGSDCDGTTLGVLEGSRVKGVACGSSQRTMGLKHPFNPAWRIHSVKIYTERENGVGNGTYDHSLLKMRPIANSDSGAFNIIQGGFRPNGVDDRCANPSAAPFYWTGANQLYLIAAVTRDDDPLSAIYVSKVEILFELDYAKPSSTLTTIEDLCV